METIKKQKKELREIKLCIFLTRVLLSLCSEVAIQISGLLIATFWSIIIYHFNNNLTVAPILFIAMFIYVKYFWIPRAKIKSDRKELTEDLAKYRMERDEIETTLK